MTTFTRTWNAAYEALPTDENFGYEIDNYIRQDRLDVRERMEVDHIWDGTVNDGKHSFPKQNLLNNSQCIVCSGSTPENVGSDLITNGTAWTGATGTTPPNNWTKIGTVTDFTIDSGLLKITAGDSIVGIWQNNTVVSGKLYKISFTYKNTAGDIAQYGIYDVTNSAYIQVVTDLASNTDATAFSIVVEAPVGCVSLRVYLLGKGNTDIVWFDSCSLYEVENGYVASDALAPDGFEKSSTCKLYRRLRTAGAYGGSIYDLEAVGDGTYHKFYWPTSEVEIQEYFYSRFAGRKVTLSATVKCSSASKARIGIIGEMSAYHSGGGAEEHLEITFDVPANCVDFYLVFEAGLSTTTRVTKIMLVFGNSIGEGNDQPIVGETIPLRLRVDLSLPFGTTPASGETAINLEAATSGKIGKGVRAIAGIWGGKNTAAGKYIHLYNAATPGSYDLLYSQVANVPFVGRFSIPVSSTGDIIFTAEDANFSEVYITITSIQT